MRTWLTVGATMLFAVAPRPAVAAGHTFSGTCTGRGTATFTGSVPAATYVVFDATGHCTGRFDRRPVWRTPVTLHAEATPGAGGLSATGFAVLTFTARGASFRVSLHHVTPAFGVDSDGRGGYVVTDETPLEPPRCDGRLPTDTVPPESPADCTGTATLAGAFAARTITPLHSA